jgi:CRISPR system Cascade subunit CasD
MSHTLLLLLAGPMQAWGTRSRFEDRDTHPEPTKSAVLGLVCAALGRERGAGLDDLNALRFGVRVERAGHPQTDYQTAQDVRTADGKIKGESEKGEAVLSTRHYLADARFLTGLSGDDLALLRDIEAALKNPRWTLSLGRKSYPLTLPPYLPVACGGSLREGTDLEEALRGEPWWYLTAREEKDGPPRSVRLLLEDPAGADTFLDAPLDFANRRFGVRRVTTHALTGDQRPKKEKHPCYI